MRCLINPHGPSFNPRPRTEGDDAALEYSPRQWLFQSTPSNGGRRHLSASMLYACSFNPRPRTEGDASSAREMLNKAEFQSTPSYGRRRAPRIRAAWKICFNSCPRTEGDLYGADSRAHDDAVSIHALAPRATWNRGHSGRCPDCFNPRPRTEGDWNNGAGAGLFCLFQPTPSHGGRPPNAVL